MRGKPEIIIRMDNVIINDMTRVIIAMTMVMELE